MKYEWNCMHYNKISIYFSSSNYLSKPGFWGGGGAKIISACSEKNYYPHGARSLPKLFVPPPRTVGPPKFFFGLSKYGRELTIFAFFPLFSLFLHFFFPSFKIRVEGLPLKIWGGHVPPSPPPWIRPWFQFSCLIKLQNDLFLRAKKELFNFHFLCLLSAMR